MRSMDDPLAPLLADHSPAIREITTRLRSLMFEIEPDIAEQVDLPDHLVAYGVGGPGGIRMRDLTVAIAPHKEHVNVQLADGAQLADPMGIVEGTGKRVRHVKCRSLDDVARPELSRLIEEQIALKRAR